MSRAPKLNLELAHTGFEYGIDFASRTIILAGDIDESQYRFISARLQQLENISHHPITIEIKSDGGVVYEALAIIGRMRNSPCEIITIGYGEVLSCALGILAAGHKRYISRHAWALYHQASASSEGRIADMAQQIKQFQREEDKFSEMLAEFTDMPKEFWLELGSKESYLTPEQCLQYGIVDKIA